MNIGFLGLGAIGLPIAENIIRLYEGSVCFFARKQEVKRRMERLGAVCISSLKGLGKYSDILFVCLGDGEQCTECLLAEDGVLSEKETGIVVICSTVGRTYMQKIEEACQNKGVRLLDAAMSGGVLGAIECSLTYMVSGSREAFQIVQPILRLVASNIYYVSDSAGDAQKIKLLNQILVGVHLAVTAEVFHAAEKMDMDLSMMYEILTNSVGNSNIFASRGPGIIQRDFSVKSSLKIIKKDLELAQELLSEYSCMAYLSDACLKIFARANDELISTEDASSVIKLFEKTDRDDSM